MYQPPQPQGLERAELIIVLVPLQNQEQRAMGKVINRVAQGRSTQLLPREARRE